MSAAESKASELGIEGDEVGRCGRAEVVSPGEHQCPSVESIHHRCDRGDAVGEKSGESSGKGTDGTPVVEPEGGGLPHPNVDGGETMLGGKEVLEHGPRGGRGSSTP